MTDVGGSASRNGLVSVHYKSLFTTNIRHELYNYLSNNKLVMTNARQTL